MKTMDKSITATITMPKNYHTALRLLAIYDGEKNVSAEIRHLVDEKAEKNAAIANLLKRK